MSIMFFGMNDLETFAAVQKPVDSKQSSAYGKLSWRHFVDVNVSLSMRTTASVSKNPKLELERDGGQEWSPFIWDQCDQIWRNIALLANF